MISPGLAHLLLSLIVATSILLMLIRPGAGGKKAAGKLGQSQMKIPDGRSVEDSLR